VSRIFLSHSSTDNAAAVALRDWLAVNGWKDDIFLDDDPRRGIAAAERWEHALSEAVSRCEAVLFLISKAWLASSRCRKELNSAHRLNKRLFALLIEDMSVGELPENLTGTWQIVDLAAGHDHVTLRATLPVTRDEASVTFSAQGLQRLKQGLEEAAVGAKYFAWPPASDPNRPPYRGLRPLEADDAGIFFGRDASIVEAMDHLRGLREMPLPRLLVILGASGTGKSSFLRAGLLPRLARDNRHFLPLPIIRPERAAISGETGLLSALDNAFAAAGMTVPRADLRVAVQGGAANLRPLLRALADKAMPTPLHDGGESMPPTLILAIDQSEELFLAEAQDEAKLLLTLLRNLLCDDALAPIVILTIRSDAYEHLQEARPFEGVRKIPFDLGPLPKSTYGEVIKGPAQRLQGTARALDIEDALVDALLADMETCGAKDALPLLAFTMERLYREHHAGGTLKLAHYEALGRVKGSIEAAVERALKAADADPAIPRDRAARLNLLRRGLIPWLAGIDHATGVPRRRVARLSEIPAEAHPLIERLVEQRLLSTDMNKDTGEPTIEAAHEALLRQWGLLQGWLTENAGQLAVLEGVKRARSDWAANNRRRAWLAHQTDRLAAAERLSERADLAANLQPADRDYLAACRKAEERLVRSVFCGLLVVFIVGLFGVINRSYISDQWHWWNVMRPYAAARVWPHVLSAAQERALKPGVSFRECAQDCPEMVVIPAGSFTMGAASDHTQPLHTVTFPKPFAVSKYELTFADWDACVAGGGCNRYKPNDEGWGRGQRPVINVTWDDARRYVRWLSRVTGKTYRLLSEAEYEYAARAGTQTVHSWGDNIKLSGMAMADCNGCRSKWDHWGPAPVGSAAPNRFGLYDMVGKVWEWTEDCVHSNYDGAPVDGSPWIAGGDCKARIIRGGFWNGTPDALRSAQRGKKPRDVRGGRLGFRVARNLVVR
jgi:formylglycine-generating enzyme required for sulfatase activity